MSDDEQLEDSLTLKFLVSHRTIELTFNTKDTISAVRNKLNDHVQIPANKILKLFYQGRVLENDHTLDHYSILPLSYIHCFIVDVISDEQRRRLQSSPETDQVRGFDRFRYYGFSDSEIQQLRLQFHSNRILSGLNPNTDVNYLQNLEEAWINSNNSEHNIDMSNDSSSHSTNNLIIVQEEESSQIGTTEDLFKGIVMGFLLGVIMLLWLPDRTLTVQTKFGIVLGISVSMCFGMFKRVLFA